VLQKRSTQIFASFKALQKTLWKTKHKEQLKNTKKSIHTNKAQKYIKEKSIKKPFKKLARPPKNMGLLKRITNSKNIN
jgi:hypothetical protein